MKPGPKPDPSKPNSRYNPASRHNRGGADRCGAGHLWGDGTYTRRTDGKKICLLCIADRKGETCKNGHNRAENINEYGACRACQAETARHRRWSDKYGLTSDDLDMLLAIQDYACKICGVPFDLDARYPFAVDHYHHEGCEGEKTCGRCIRGILCRDCNSIVKTQMDDRDFRYSVVKYLDTWFDVTWPGCKDLPPRN